MLLDINALMETSFNKSVLLIGCARSGTTLLSELIGKHNDVFISPETKFFQYIYSQRHVLNLLGKKRKNELILKSLLVSEYSNNPEKVFPQYIDELKELIDRFSGDLVVLFGKVLELMGKGNRIIGEKTPWHSFFIDKLPKETQIIAITRRCTPTVASLYKRRGFRNVETINACVARWIATNEFILAQEKSMSSDRFYRVQFESLIDDPEKELREICDFLDIDYQDSMVQPIGQDSSNIGTGAQDADIDRNANSRYRDKLSPDEISYIEEQSSRLEGLLGYQDNHSSVKMTPGLRIEYLKMKMGVMVMRSGFYPYGASRFSQLEV